MKLYMTSGYGDISSNSYVDFADDDEAKRLLDLKAARTVATDDKDSNFVADSHANYMKVGKAKPAPGGTGL